MHTLSELILFFVLFRSSILLQVSHPALYRSHKMTLRRSCALQMLSLATSAAKLVLLSTFLVTIHCYALSSIESSTFHGRTLVTETVHRSKSASCSSCNRIGSYLVMRKQKASDRRTRRRQRGEELDQQQVESNISVLTKPRTITSSPMAEASWNHKQPLQKCRSQPVRPASTKKGRGRSRKRSALYSLLSFYNNKFLDLLTAEYQVEVSSWCESSSFFRNKV